MLVFLIVVLIWYVPRNVYLVCCCVVYSFVGEARAGGGFGQHSEGSRSRHLGPRVQRAGGVSFSARRRFRPGEVHEVLFYLFVHLLLLIWSK